MTATSCGRELPELMHLSRGRNRKQPRFRYAVANGHGTGQTESAGEESAEMWCVGPLRPPRAKSNCLEGQGKEGETPVDVDPMGF